MAKIQGPECPKCECPDTEVIGIRLVFGERRERCECDFCGHVFTPEGLVAEAPAAARAESVDVEAPVEHDPARPGAVSYNAAPPRCICPACKARNPPVKSTTKDGARTIRYHRCECGLKFKSIEGDG